jgi:hypothetical protein
MFFNIHFCPKIKFSKSMREECAPQWKTVETKKPRVCRGSVLVRCHQNLTRLCNSDIIVQGSFDNRVAEFADELDEATTIIGSASPSKVGSGIIIGDSQLFLCRMNQIQTVEPNVNFGRMIETLNPHFINSLQRGEAKYHSCLRLASSRRIV